MRRFCKRVELTNRQECSNCHFRYAANEIFPSEKQECLYCVFQRGCRADIEQIQAMVRGNPMREFKLRRFIEVTQQSFIALPSQKESA